MYVLEVVDSKSRPSVICSAQIGVAGSGAERHTRPSQGARREPPHPEKSEFIHLSDFFFSVYIMTRKELIWMK